MRWGGTSSKRGGNKKCIYKFVMEKKRQLGTPRRRWEDNIITAFLGGRIILKQLFRWEDNIKTAFLDGRTILKQFFLDGRTKLKQVF
jgi:hypothetical protein